MYNRLEKIDENSKIHSKLLKVIGEQRSFDEITILENSNGLSDSAISNFRIWLIENKIRHNVVYCVRQLPLEYLRDVVRGADTIAFETTGTYEIVRTLTDYISFL